MWLPTFVEDLLAKKKFTPEQIKLLRANWDYYSQIWFTGSTTAEIVAEAHAVLASIELYGDQSKL